ncbi:MAG TPA: glycoside hydrolase family 88 protein, partial [Gemmatimonadales bacterium]|nr:glycoside hydrolase family 88 protein [Gemmatimonadales bacterium]
AVADGVLRDATFDFVDSATERHYAVPDSAPAGARLRIASAYNDWRYWNGVLNLAMPRVAAVLGDPRYLSFAGRHVAFAFDNAGYFERRHVREDKWSYPFGQLFTMEDPDDYGAEGAAVVDLLAFRPDGRWRQYVERAADHLSTRQGRLPDGTLARSVPRRWTVWADDLFMSVPFLARMAALSGDSRYLDDAIRQVISFHRHLFDARAGLMHHNWYSDSAGGEGSGAGHGVAFWGRANGWTLMAQVELLDRLPPGHPQRDTLLALFRRHVEGIARYQDRTTGLWHQLLDKPDSYFETSASAMFTFAIAHGVRQRYLAPSYADVARRSWAGVLTRIRPDGQIEGTCAGTDVSDNLADYYARPTPLNDPHGIGAVLLAGSEILQLRP